MTQREEPGYFIDQERMEEMYRLARQERIVTAAVGGLLPEKGGTFEGMHDVLDVACGSGGWALDVGEGFPGVRVVGIDKSERMIAFAQVQASHMPNVIFSRMDATRSLEFPDNSFDLINARMIHGFMPKHIWPLFLQECWRLLRPQGMIRLTQDDSPATSSAAFEQIVEWGCRHCINRVKASLLKGVAEEFLMHSIICYAMLVFMGCIRVPSRSTFRMVLPIMSWSCVTSRSRLNLGVTSSSSRG